MKSRVCRARFLQLVLMLGAGLVLSACGTSSNLYVTKGLQEPLDARTATVVTAGNGVKLSKYARKLKDMLGHWQEHVAKELLCTDWRSASEAGSDWHEVKLGKETAKVKVTKAEA